VSLTKGLRLRRRGASRRRQRGKCKIIEANEKSPSETGAAGRLDAGSGTQRIKCAATRRRREGNQGGWSARNHSSSSSRLLPRRPTRFLIRPRPRFAREESSFRRAGALAGAREARNDGAPVFAWGRRSRWLDRVFPARRPLPWLAPWAGNPCGRPMQVRAVRAAAAKGGASPVFQVLVMSRHHSCRRPLARRCLITLPPLFASLARSRARWRCRRKTNGPWVRTKSSGDGRRRVDYAPSPAARTELSR
jgi:hypothetical protein